ncbi:MAG: hypothetical protein M5R42_01190 [Rhodocyclaceae bacterium]|nr:hypothetical protein [Rhodocyclaceae bacterium]
MVKMRTAGGGAQAPDEREVLRWFANTPAARVGIEACGGAHYWARELMGLGHDVRIFAAAIR